MQKQKQYHAEWGYRKVSSLLPTASQIGGGKCGGKLAIVDNPKRKSNNKE